MNSGLKKGMVSFACPIATSSSPSIAIEAAIERTRRSTQNNFFLGTQQFTAYILPSTQTGDRFVCSEI